MRFAHQYLLLFLPLLAVGAYLLHRYSQTKAKERLQKFSPAMRLPTLLRTLNLRARRWKFYLVATALGLLLVVLARPLLDPGPNTADQKGVEFFIILDVSKSMLVRDVAPSRLGAVKKSLGDWLKTRAGDRIGLILVAGDAFVQAPLTNDYTAFREVLDQSDPKAMSLGGTNISSAVKVMVQTFEKIETKNRIAIIISDGENLEGSVVQDISAAHLRYKINFLTVGVGSPQGGRVPDKDLGPDYAGPIKEAVRDEYGMAVNSRLDERTLRNIAAAGGGRYFPFDPQGATWEKLYNQELKQIARTTESRNVHDCTDLFQIPLMIAILLCVGEMAISTRLKNPPRPVSIVTLPEPARKPIAMTMKPAKKVGLQAVKLIVCAGLFFLANSGLAAPTEILTTIENAEKMVKEGKSGEAAEMLRATAQKYPDDYFLMYNYGIAAYSAGRFQEAIDAFSEVNGSADEKLRSSALFQLGNAQFRLGEALQKEGKRRGGSLAFERAADYYKGALAERSNRNAKQNLRVTELRLESIWIELGLSFQKFARDERELSGQITHLTQSFEYLEKAISLRPENEKAKTAFAETRKMLSEALTRQAREQRDKAARADPAKDNGKQQEQLNAAADTSYEQAREIMPEDQALAQEHEEFKKAIAEQLAQKAEAQIDEAMAGDGSIKQEAKKQQKLKAALAQIDQALLFDATNQRALGLQKKALSFLEQSHVKLGDERLAGAEKSANTKEPDLAVEQLIEAMQNFNGALEINPENKHAREQLAKTEKNLAIQLTAAGKAEMAKALAAGRSPGLPNPTNPGRGTPGSPSQTDARSGEPRPGAPQNQAALQEKIARLEKAAQSFAQADALSPGQNNAAALEEQANELLAQLREELDAALMQQGSSPADGESIAGQPGTPGAPGSPSGPMPGMGPPGPFLSFSEIRGGSQEDGMFKELSQKSRIRDW